MAEIMQIEGSTISDTRGKIKFFNTFNMSQIVRFYEISPTSTEIIRGWQGHHKEKKWFYCHTGAFVINTININGEDISTKNRNAKRYVLKEDNPLILEVPQGNATAFRSLENDSKLMVFSNFTLEESINDDIRFPLETWNAQF